MTFDALPGHTLFFLGLITLLAIAFHIRYSEKAANYGPTILTTLGIFATFFGIAVGLSSFDTANVQASVPSLLEGLKTAFWASVAGVGGALTIKLRHYFFTGKEPSGSGADGEVTAADLAQLLKGIQQALVGDDESTLVSQLKLIRVDTNERLDALKRAQHEALQRLGEMGSAALVEALRDVIRDFNVTINEQFGDNFRQLNLAVGKLLVWQEQFKAYITEATERHNQVITSMKVASESYEQLVSNAGTFSVVAKDLSTLLESLQVQKQQLTTALTGLANLLKAASGSLPQIETKVLALTDQLTKAVATNQEQVNAALTENSRLTRSANNDFNRQMGELLARTNQQVQVLDAALEKELTKSLEKLGQQLAALSDRFATDYGPVADKLRELVQVSRRPQ